jgi:hypothetical protein
MPTSWKPEFLIVSVQGLNRTRQVVFQMAEVVLLRELFRDILRAIEHLRLATAVSGRRWNVSKMRGNTGCRREGVFALGGKACENVQIAAKRPCAREKPGADWKKDLQSCGAGRKS